MRALPAMLAGILLCFAIALPAGAAPSGECLEGNVTSNGVPCFTPDVECLPVKNVTPNGVPCVRDECLKGNVTENGVPCFPGEPVKEPTPEPTAKPTPEPKPEPRPTAEPPPLVAAAPKSQPAAEARPEPAPQRATKRRRRARQKPDEPAPAPVAAPLSGEPVTLPESMFQAPPQVPAYLEAIHRRAGAAYGIPWQILAAINELETDFGRNVAVSSAGAVGWMQFMPPTWKQYGRDASGDGEADPYDPQDAIYSAARYLAAAGAQEDLPRAIFAYNHADWYVEAVLLRARMIGDPDPALEKLLDLRGERLERKVLEDERITIYGCGREDIAEHRIDRRVLLTLRFLAESDLHPTVTSLECGHSVYTRSGNISQHSVGSAVDIAAINDTPLIAGQGPGSVGERAVRALLSMRGIMKPNQIISLMTFAGADNTYAMGDHADHIHVGFRPLR